MPPPVMSGGAIYMYRYNAIIRIDLKDRKKEPLQ